MSSKRCSVEEFAAQLGLELDFYSQEVTDEVKKAVDTVAKEVNETIREHVTFKERSGDYVKAFRTKKTYEDRSKKVDTWYVKDPEYRLTHLLENGHALPQGGRADAFPHIKYGQELAEKRMLELSEEAAKNAGH